MKMKKRYKVIITTILMLLTLLFARPSVQAATPKWKKVYKNFLQRNGDIYEYYFVIDEYPYLAKAKPAISAML